MKKKLLKAMALCLVLLFTATVAYAWDGNTALNSQKVTIAYDNSDEDENEYDDDNGYDEKNKGHKKGKNKGEDKEEHKKPKEDKGNKKPEYVAVTGITLNKTSTTIAVGSWERLTASVQPSNATDKKYFWFSKDPQVASVNPSGKVTGRQSGTAEIFVATRDGFETDSCTVTVTGTSSSEMPVTGVSLNRTELTMDIGATQRLTATVTPSNASDKDVTWSSSDTDIVTVDRNGYVYAVSAGEAVITVRTEDGGKTAECDVTVRNRGRVPVTSVSIVKTESYVALKEDTTKRLIVEILPENATNKDVTWSSSNSNVVTVDQNGNITGENEGSATITVVTIDGNKTDFCTVKVLPADEWESVDSVRLNLNSTTIPVGFTDKLRYEIEPSDASNHDVQWSSSNSNVASVNPYGEIEAKRTGTAVITVTTVDGSRKDSCKVIVVSAPDEPTHGILLNKKASTMEEGQTDYPTVIFYPSDEDDYSLTWTSSDTDVATVNHDGRVTAKEPGAAVITVRTSNNWSASYTVSVVP